VGRGGKLGGADKTELHISDYRRGIAVSTESEGPERSMEKGKNVWSNSGMEEEKVTLESWKRRTGS